MKRPAIYLIAFAVVIVLAGVAYAAYSSYSSNFARSVNPTRTAPGAAATCGTPVPSSGLRTFQIVPDQTTASYTVRENLIIRNLPNNNAVGKTHNVQGQFRIRSGSSPLVADMKITADLTTLQSDEERRDRFVANNYLDSSTYPTATFVSTCAQGLPANYNDGQTVTFQIVGNLTVHGKTNKETFNVQGKLANNTITGTATTTVFMTDFDIQPPNIANFVVAENKVLITIDFTAKEA